MSTPSDSQEKRHLDDALAEVAGEQEGVGQATPEGGDEPERPTFTSWASSIITWS
jgi:hypothetical protein